jgi:hypothetical protein
MQTFLISERSEMQRHCSANWLNVAPMVRRDPSRGDGHREWHQVKATTNRFIHASQARLVISRNDQLRGKLEEVLTHEPGRDPIATGK